MLARGVLGTIATSLGVKPGEGRRTVRLFSFIFLFTLAAVFARSAQREIFLAAFPRSAISDAFLYSAGVLCLASIGISVIAARLSLVRLMNVLLGAASVALIGFSLALGVWPQGAAMGLYVAVEVFVSLLMAQGWAVASEAVDIRSAKRLLPVIGLGAGLAWTLGGLAIGAVARLTGPTVLLWLTPLSLLGAFFVLRQVAAKHVREEPKKREPAQGGVFAGLVDGLQYIASEPLTRVLAAAITIELVVEKVTDLQLLATAQARFLGQSGGISAFMGLFYGVTGAITLAAPFISGRVLSRWGSTRAMLVMQGFILVGSGLFLAVPEFFVVVALCGGDRVLKQALGSPARSQVLGALPTVRRIQAGALLRGVLAAAFSALAAAGLKAMPADLPVHLLSVGSVVLMLGLVVVTRQWLHQSYLIALQRSVDRTRIDLDSVREEQSLDREQLLTLTEELASPDPNRASMAVALLGSTDIATARPLLAKALAHPVIEVRAQAAGTLGKKGGAADVPVLLGALTTATEEAELCAELKALIDLKAAAAGPALLPLAESPIPRVRALACVCRLRLRELTGAAQEGVETELAAVERLLSSQAAEERTAAAWAMGQVPLHDPRIRERFSPLLADAEAEVRKAAIGASGHFTDGPIVRALVFALEEPGTSQAAYDAFVQLGDEGVSRVEEVLKEAPVAIVSRTASALSRGGGGKATEVLGSLLTHSDAQVRYRASRALVTRRRTTDWRPPAEALLLRAVEEELKQGYRYHAALAALSRELKDGDLESRFVAGEIDSRIQETERRLLALVAVVADPRIARLSHQLRDASPQVTAKVLELVEESLDQRLSAEVMPFLERQNPEQKAAIGTQKFRVPEAYASDPLLALVESGDDHLRRVARLAFKARIAERFPELANEEDPLLQMVERLRFLRSVPVFKDLNPEDLMKLAEIASPVEYPAGTVIFKKGDPGDVMCVVVRGKVENRDRGQVVATQKANDFFGELALFDQEPRSADAVCVEDTEVLEIGGADLESLMERRPEIAREIIRVLAKRLRATTAKMVASSLGGAKS